MALTSAEVDICVQATIICKGCHIEKPITEYWGATNGHCQHKTCKKCHSIRKKAYREANKEKLALQKRKYYQANREKCLGQSVKYRKDNVQYFKDYNKKRYRENKIAMREQKLQTAYKIGLIEYNEFFIIQSGQCAICGKHQKELKKRLHVDHDHKTGKVRGLLCNRCNLGLGTLGDSVDTIQKTLAYLENNHGINGG